MFTINVRYRSIIEYYDNTMSKEAAYWISDWLRKPELMINYDNPDYLVIDDFPNFMDEVEKANPPEEIEKDVKQFFDICIKAYKRLGYIYIDLFN